ncbi:MAG TPA: hypothetical protein VGC72_16080, partial [Candidatus Elarobacter sp.]
MRIRLGLFRRTIARALLAVLLIVPAAGGAQERQPTIDALGFPAYPGGHVFGLFGTQLSYVASGDIGDIVTWYRE